MKKEITIEEFIKKNRIGIIDKQKLEYFTKWKTKYYKEIL